MTRTFFQLEGIDECSLIVPSNESAKMTVAPPCSDQMCSSMLVRAKIALVALFGLAQESCSWSF